MPDSAETVVWVRCSFTEEQVRYLLSLLAPICDQPGAEEAFPVAWDCERELDGAPRSGDADFED